MFYERSKCIRRFMPKPKGMTCGVPSNWIVYGIGILSVIEAVFFLTIFSILVEKVERGKKPTASETWWFTDIHVEKVVSYAAISIYTIRLILAGILIVGQYLRIAAFLATYFILTLLGIVLSTLIGMEAAEHVRTRGAGSAVMSLGIAHLVGAIIVLKVCKEMRVEQLRVQTIERSSPNVIQIPPPVTPPAPTPAPEPRSPALMTPAIRDMPLPLYPPVYPPAYIQPADVNEYDSNPEMGPKFYRPQPMMTNEYRVQCSSRSIKPPEEDDDVPTIYYAPQQAPPRYSEIDIENRAGHSGQQKKVQKDDYFGFSNA